MRKELKRDNNPKYDDLFSGVELFESKFSLKDYKDILFGKQTPASILQKKHAPSVLKLLKGKVIEIGATTYKPFFKDFSINATEYIQTNLYPENKDILKLDAENIALDDNSVDGIVCFNVMEHIYDFNKALDEFYRVLKPGGVLVLSNPFLFPYHGAPDDYCRFTHSFYQRKLKDYKELKIYQLGNRFDTIASLLQGYEFYRLPQKRLNFLSLLSLLFMKLSEYFKKPDVYSLFYTVVATKDECNDL